jgi:hypothetical protein
MPDTPPLRAHFHLPPGTTPGVGYPMGKLMGLLDLATGMFVSLLALRCRTVAGVKKELAVYLAAYNLVRLAMLKAARDQRVSPERISFVDAQRWLLVRLLGLGGVGRLIVNPDRKGRSQLRVIRRRLKQYDLLRKPRREEEAERAAKQAVKD